MKIFLDTGDVDAIRQAAATGLINGATNNPSIIAKTGRGFRDTITETYIIVSIAVSAEAMAETVDEMISEAQEIASSAPDVIVNNRTQYFRASGRIIQ